MKFSIIIPYYNGSRFLDSLFITLDDYFNSKDCEIIIVDDCSDIEEYNKISKQVLLTYANNIKLMRNEKNLGPSFSRQVGVEEASGEFIAFLDADDGWSKNRAFLLYALIKRCNGDIYGGAHKQIKQTELTDYRGHNIAFEKNIKKLSFRNFLFKNYYATSSVIVRRDVLLKHNFNTSLRYSEDYECWRRIARTSSAFLLDQSGAFCFKHVYISHDKNSLSAATLKMSTAELYGMYLLLNNSEIPVHLRLLIPFFMLFSIFKAWVRLFRVVIKL